MLPFLKNRHEASSSMPVETLERKSDDGAEFDTLDAVAHDLLEALDKKDKGMLKEALSALCEHIASQDAKQDEDLK